MKDSARGAAGRRQRTARRQAWFLLVVLAGATALVAGCKSGTEERQNAEIVPVNLYMFAPLPALQPATGVAALRVDLGRRLFYDRHLSANSSISCNNCHELTKYGVDPGEAVSLGHDQRPGSRNAPTVYNAGLQFAQFWDGRAADLAAQASGPMLNPVEMGMPGPAAVLAYLHANKEYVKQFKQAYPDAKDPVTMEDVTGAIAAFEGRLLTPSPWDMYLVGDTNALTPAEKRGLRVYLKAGCADCHAGQDMGGNSYQKLGVYRNWPDQETDTGRMAVTKETRDRMYFKVPILRNVAETGPWFHNGQVKTLNEAVRLMGRYQTGEQLSDEEVNSIVSYLHALTGAIPQAYIEPPASEAAAASAPGKGSKTQTTAKEGD